MAAVEIRGVKIGAGIPKICVPIVASSKEAILAEAETFGRLPLDVVEWRADWFEAVSDVEKTIETAKGLRNVLGETPILFTFRTAKEGGEKEIELSAYKELNVALAKSGYVDLVDVEAFSGDDIVKEIITEVHKTGVKVVASNHDFQKTPDKEEIINRLCKMLELGADIPKIAVMPQSKKDVLTLLEATAEMKEKYPECPIITMSMAAMGVVSRLAGETFGSALTFGAAKKASAPGQIGVEDLAEILRTLHNE